VPPDPAVTRRGVIARLLVLAPLSAGVLLVEGIFAARGERGDLISVPAAGLALVLLWLGTGWALRSWLALLLALLPALMLTLGAALVGDLAPAGGAILLVVGTVLLMSVAWYRLSAGPRPPGQVSALGGGIAGRSWPAYPSSGAHVPPAEGRTPASPADPAAIDDPARAPFRPLDPLGAHFLNTAPPPHPADAGQPPGPGPDIEVPYRPAPGWDTSATDRAARDGFVASIKGRGGATAPTLASLEEFFAGNGDPRSIAPSLRGAVPLQTFRSVMHRIRAHPAVSELLVQVEPLEPGRYPAGEWPLAGSLHVVATLSAAEIDALAADLHPDASLGPLPAAELADGTPAPAGSHEFAIWWG
jgi:hypothetical protein